MRFVRLIRNRECGVLFRSKSSWISALLLDFARKKKKEVGSPFLHPRQRFSIRPSARLSFFLLPQPSLPQLKTSVVCILPAVFTLFWPSSVSSLLRRPSEGLRESSPPPLGKP